MGAYFAYNNITESAEATYHTLMCKQKGLGMTCYERQVQE